MARRGKIFGSTAEQINGIRLVRDWHNGQVCNEHCSQAGAPFRVGIDLKAVFECNCGNLFVTRVINARRGDTTSCGCVAKQGNNKKHGFAKSPDKIRTYRCWADMKKRCLNPNATGYKHYGGRGITVCDRWLNSFENFLADMGEPEGDDLTLDRIDVNSGYSPENCRWATWHQQHRNKRNSVLIEAFGEKKTAVDWSLDSRCTISRSALFKRLESGMSAESAITEPYRHRHPSHLFSQFDQS